MSRYLFLPILKTMQFPTWLAVAKLALTSGQLLQATERSLTCVYHARNGPAASSWPGVSQNFRNRDLEMTRTATPDSQHVSLNDSSQNANHQGMVRETQSDM